MATKRSSKVLALIFTAFVMILSGCGDSTESSNSSFKAPELGDPADQLPIACEALRYFELHNLYRKSLGLSELYFSRLLYPAAQWHAEDMVANNYLAHVDSLGRNPSQRVAAFGYPAPGRIGENAAALSNPAAEAVFCGWKNSPGHHANMIRAQYTGIALGYGVDTSPYAHTWSSVFTTARIEGDPVQPISVTPNCPAATTLPSCP